MPYVYILKSVNNNVTYVGSTLNLENRLKEHNQGKSTFTSRYKPWVIFYSEELSTLKEARTREKYYKSASGRKKIKVLLEEYIPR